MQVLPNACWCFLQVLQCPPETCSLIFTTVFVGGSVNGCLVLCVSSVIDWRLVEVPPPPPLARCHLVGSISLQPSRVSILAIKLVKQFHLQSQTLIAA